MRRIVPLPSIKYQKEDVLTFIWVKNRLCHESGQLMVKGIMCLTLL